MKLGLDKYGKEVLTLPLHRPREAAGPCQHKGVAFMMHEGWITG